MKVYSSLLSGARWPKNVAAFAVTALALSVAGPNANAQPPDRGATKTVQGTVRRSTTAPMGEIDGAVLDDGTVIHWPPHLAERASRVAVRGDQVRATGWMETGPEGCARLGTCKQRLASITTHQCLRHHLALALARGVGRLRRRLHVPGSGARLLRQRHGRCRERCNI
jgi:hypothetical protein